MEKHEATTERVRDALRESDFDLPVIRIESLSTLPHSSVSRVELGDGRTVILKQAGSAAFADGMRKELVVNRDVLSKLPEKVAPALLTSNADAELPWLVFEDVSVSYEPVMVQTPPAFSYIEKFVKALGKVHAQSSHLDIAAAFAGVQGDVYITDGSEQAANVLDAFLRDCDPDRFPPRTYDLIEKIRDNIPAIVGLLSGHSVLVHGDAHFGNALYANDALLLDWALAVVGPGEVDLCHALALNLPRYFASEYEPVVVRQYAAICSEFGFDHNESDVMDRYRMCLLLTVIVAVGMRTVPGMQDSVWSYMFTNAVHSALDHDSLAYLG